MAYENTTGIGVYAQYGPREVGSTIGVERSTDSFHQLSVYFNENTFNDGFIPAYVIPEGAKFLRGILTVEQAVAGATAVLVGEDGNEAANGVVLTTLFGTEGTYVLGTSDAVGEWAFTPAAFLTTDQTVGVAITGTATAGRGTLTLEYILKKRDGSAVAP